MGRAISYAQLAPATAIGLGYTVGTPALWSTLTTYNLGDVVKDASGNYFVSKAGTNLNHALPVPANGKHYTAWWAQIDAVTGIPSKAVFAKLQAETQAVRY